MGGGRDGAPAAGAGADHHGVGVVLSPGRSVAGFVGRWGDGADRGCGGMRVAPAQAAGSASGPSRRGPQGAAPAAQREAACGRLALRPAAPRLP